MDKEKILYIHMGLHKTGSTSLQYFCQAMRETLIREYGVYYPPAGKKLNHRHKSLFPVSGRVFRKIAEYADSRNCPSIVISNETLSHRGLADECLGKIRAAAPDHTVKIILYVRRLDDLCKAWFSERCKTAALGSDETYASFMEKSFRKRAHIMFPSLLIEKCMRQVGEQNVIVRPYTRESLKNGDIIDDFFDILGISLPAGLRPSRAYNVSPPHAALPYFTSSVFSSSSDSYAEVRISKKLRTAFTYPGPGHVPSRITAALADEVERLDARFLKGFKKTFDKRPLDLQFPELEADPYRVHVAEMLHALYRRVTWPEALVWRVGLFFYHTLNKVGWLQKRLLAFVPSSRKKTGGN